MLGTVLSTQYVQIHLIHKVGATIKGNLGNGCLSDFWSHSHSAQDYFAFAMPCLILATSQGKEKNLHSNICF